MGAFWGTGTDFLEFPLGLFTDFAVVQTAVAEGALVSVLVGAPAEWFVRTVFRRIENVFPRLGDVHQFYVWGAYEPGVLAGGLNRPVDLHGARINAGGLYFLF